MRKKSMWRTLQLYNAKACYRQCAFCEILKNKVQQANTWYYINIITQIVPCTVKSDQCLICVNRLCITIRVD